jgi:hypothetical protein
MALPNIPNPQKMTYPAAVPDMANQVIFEGFLARSWVHNNCRFLRLANQRPPQAGRQSDGRLMVESDYVTVRLDPSVYFDMDRATPGLRLVARGRIEGHDIPETIGDILRHCNLNIRVPQDIQHITVSRPAVQIFCTSIEFRKDKPGINQQQSYQHNKNHRHSDRPFRPTQRSTPARARRRQPQPSRLRKPPRRERLPKRLPQRRPLRNPPSPPRRTTGRSRSKQGPTIESGDPVVACTFESLAVVRVAD